MRILLASALLCLLRMLALCTLLCTLLCLPDAQHLRLSSQRRCVFAAAARSADSNPGAATPYSLYKLYSKQAAATANPFTLRQTGGLSFHAMKSSKSYASVPTSNGDTLQLLQQSALPAAPSRALAVTGGSMRSRSDSPPRASFRLLVDPAPQQRQGHLGELTLSLTSLR